MKTTIELLQEECVILKDFSEYLVWEEDMCARQLLAISEQRQNILVRLEEIETILNTL